MSKNIDDLSGSSLVERVLSTATSAQIFNHVPKPILDAVIEERLKSIPARLLIHFLARAHRLGYELGKDGFAVVPDSRQFQDADEAPVTKPAERERNTAPQTTTQPTTSPHRQDQRTTTFKATWRCDYCNGEIPTREGYYYVSST